MSWTEKKPIAPPPSGDWYEVMEWIPLAVSVPVYDASYGRGVVLCREEGQYRWRIAFEKGRNPDFHPDPEKLGTLPWVGARQGQREPEMEFDGNGLQTMEARNVRVNLEEPQGFAYAMRWYLCNTDMTAAVWEAEARERMLIGENNSLDRLRLATSIANLKTRLRKRSA